VQVLDRAHGRHVFTVDDLDRMVVAGVFGPDERVELLDGEIVDVSPLGPEHAWAGDALHRLLARAYGEAAWLRDQRPLVLGPCSRPEPDLAVVRARDYRHAHATGADAVLVVEIALSSIDLDRAKAGLYAAGGVAEYWLVDVAARTLTVHREPSPSGYRHVAVVDEHGEVELPEAGGTLRVASILP
jgi:Uma2 family endonuclease